MFKKTAHFFFYIFFVCEIVSLILLCIHIYFGDINTNTSRHFFPPNSEFITTDTQNFSVAIISDTGANDTVLEQIVDKIVTSNPQPNFILHLGDILTHRTSAGLYWILDEIYPKLHGIPLYFVPGNHDVKKDDVRDILAYKTVFGPSYYWFGYNNVLFIGMDTSFETIDDKQLKWLDDTLTKIRPLFKHCIIFTHVPPVDVQPNLVSDKALDFESAKKFESVVSHKKIDAMIFGHVHYYSESKFAGIPVYTVPSSGQTIRSDVNKYGYITLDFMNGKLEKVIPKYIDFNGPMREYTEYFVVRKIFHYVLRKIISYIMLPGLFALLICLGLLWYHKKQKRYS